ncbi:MAG: efflux RND transporter periplasmic adaptor subunit [Sphingobacteriales bacterium]|nr:MAG: efflux RND transporter periplasmic adaptor subunit [Sphingobacteriales bacterium]
MQLIFSKTYYYKVLMIGLLSVLAGCGPQKATEPPQQPVAAELILLHPENTVIENTYPAHLEGKVNVEIRPQVSGYIDKIHIDEGAYVKSGQPLFTINAGVYREQRNTSQAALEMAESQLATAKLDMDKYTVLTEKKVVADFSYQKAKAAYAAARAAVKQQQAQVAAADLNLGFAVVKAPVSGFIGRIPKRLGALVSPSDAQPLTTLSQVDRVYAYFSMPESEILRIHETRAGNTLLQQLQTFNAIGLQMANGKLYEHSGKIDMMDGQFDAGTGAVTLRATFVNPQLLLRSGNTGRVVLRTEQTGVFRIPVLATYEMQDKIFVGLLDAQNRVHRVALEDHIKSGDYYIITSGFKAGDRIIARELASIPEKSLITAKKAQ